MDQDPLSKRGIRFDATINLGHVLTVLSILIAGFGAWSTLDKRVVILEEGDKYREEALEQMRRNQTLIDESQNLRFNDNLREVKELLTRLDRRVEKLQDREK